MVGPLNPKPGSPDLRLSGPTRRTAVGLILGAPLLGACSGGQVSNPFASPQNEGPACKVIDLANTACDLIPVKLADGSIELVPRERFREMAIS